MRLRLYNYVFPSSGDSDENRGFAQSLLDNGYAQYLADKHGLYEAEAAAAGVTLGLDLINGWGRDDESLQLPNGVYTSQRLDQKVKCFEDGFTTITDDIHDNTDPTKTRLYVGAIPVNTMAYYGWTEEIQMGYGWIFDALSAYDADSPMFQEALALSNNGARDVSAEANGSNKGLPLFAFAGLWEIPARVNFTEAPPYCSWCWRREETDDAWNHTKAVEALSYDLRLSVRLENLTSPQRSSLYAAIVEAGEYAEERRIVKDPRFRYHVKRPSPREIRKYGRPWPPPGDQ